MPITPEEAFRITPDVEQAAAAFCDAVDEYLQRHASFVGAVTRIPLQAIKTPIANQKSRWRVAELYRDAGWPGAWFENGWFVLVCPRCLASGKCRGETQARRPRGGSAT